VHASPDACASSGVRRPSARRPDLPLLDPLGQCIITLMTLLRACPVSVTPLIGDYTRIYHLPTLNELYALKKQ
jgi:hypothetical protein